MKTYYSRTFRLHVLLWMQRPIEKRCKGVSKVVLYRTHRAIHIFPNDPSKLARFLFTG